MMRSSKIRKLLQESSGKGACLCSSFDTCSCKYVNVVKLLQMINVGRMKPENSAKGHLHVTIYGLLKTWVFVPVKCSRALISADIISVISGPGIREAIICM